MPNLDIELNLELDTIVSAAVMDVSPGWICSRNMQSARCTPTPRIAEILFRPARAHQRAGEACAGTDTIGTAWRDCRDGRVPMRDGADRSSPQVGRRDGRMISRTLLVLIFCRLQMALGIEIVGIKQADYNAIDPDEYLSLIHI